MISGQVPTHLVVGARTGFLRALRARTYPWQRIANTLNMDAKSVDLVDLGAAPMPVESKTGVDVQDFIEKTVEVKPRDWNITVFISENAIDDDQTGTLESRVRSAGANFQKHINKLMFEALNGGDGSTFGLAYDGNEFFDTQHVDNGAQYTTVQSNLNTLTLSQDNFETAWVAAQQLRDDQGEFTELIYDLLVVHPTNYRIARQITGNPEAYDTANREINPWNGMVDAISSPYFDTTAWALIASSENVKPLILAMRKPPELQDAWFDPTAPDGGRYYFKFFARYYVAYSDWRTAYLGAT